MDEHPESDAPKTVIPTTISAKEHESLITLLDKSLDRAILRGIWGP